MRVAVALVRARVDHVVVTGDVTHRGRVAELRRFEAVFEPLLAQGRVTVVPGNHDRMTDDVRHALMPGGRVQVSTAPGLHLVRLDSTGRHNRSVVRGHGVLHAHELDEMERALQGAAEHALAVVLLHHHPAPLPADDLADAVTMRLGLGWCKHLHRGGELLERAARRAGLVLHGHRHRAGELRLGELRVVNAGSTTRLGRFRVFRHRGGRLAGEPEWLPAD